MTATVADIIALMDKIAPAHIAEDWDNTGLQIGRKDWIVKKIRVALDPLPEVIADACHNSVNMLITHHPLMFNPIKNLDLSTPVGQVVDMAVRHKLVVFSAHTNLDSAPGGINDVLAALIGLKNVSVLTQMPENKYVKLVVYVPKTHEQPVLNALFETQAGNIGQYSCCSFRHPGIGTFKPDNASTPFIGKKGEVCHADEIRIEAVIPKAAASHAIRHIRASHPYETMAYDVYPLTATEQGIRGLGRIGTLETEMRLDDLARRVKQNLNLEFLKIVGEPDMPVRRIALCSGSGSSLMKDFLSSDAQVYITGDLRYHDARDALNAGRALIDAGHFPSEHIIVKVLAEQLRKQVNSMNVDVDVCGIEKDAFRMI